jgi:hypothetical protein
MNRIQFLVRAMCVAIFTILLAGLSMGQDGSFGAAAGWASDFAGAIRPKRSARDDERR